MANSSGPANYNVLGWTNNLIGWTLTIVTSLIAAGGAALVISAADIERIRLEIKPIVQETETRLKEQLDALRSTQRDVIKENQHIKNEVREVSRLIESEARMVESLLNAAARERNRLANGLDSNRDKVREVSMRLTEESHQISENIASARLTVAEGQRKIRDQIEDLANQFHAYQQSFINEVTELAEDGKKMIDGKTVIDADQAAEARDWIAKANYMIRSLAIPTEAGWLRDTSAVKEDLRKAMVGFEKGDGEARMEHVRRVLVIVEAIRDLAQGGRIP